MVGIIGIRFEEWGNATSRIVLALCVGVFMTVIAGCGGSDSTSSKPASEESVHTVGEVKAAFESVTGEKFRDERVLDLTIQGGGRSVVLLPEEASIQRYGEFRFIVQTEDASNPRLSTVERPDTSPDQHGIFWQYQPPDEFGGKHWSATKYLNNVKLVWFNDVRRVNERWQTLDVVLDRLRDDS